MARRRRERSRVRAEALIAGVGAPIFDLAAPPWAANTQSRLDEDSPMTRTVLFDSPFLLGFEHTRALIDRAAKAAAES